MFRYEGISETCMLKERNVDHRQIQAAVQHGKEGGRVSTRISREYTAAVFFALDCKE